MSALPSGARAFRDDRSLEERLTDASQTGMAVWLDPAPASGEVMWPARTVLVALVGAACVGMLAGAALIHAHGTLARAFS
ncbi:hypothetical protein [Aureimonas mangrovi]|uniref:hypothetical protein n=1 Tax=Aureimonas mangrovi TaxID=2758041 RepID=UPI00163D5BCE|nr:hypothetical protein [Aureimonas mangrovi]